VTRLTLPILAVLALAACEQNTDTSKTNNPHDSNQTVVDEDGDGYTTDDGDCNDSDSTIHPDATELCDGTDSNCDGVYDDDLMSTWYQDGDTDGFGSGAGAVSCDPGAGWSDVDGDCDDADPAVNPDAQEVCNGYDDNCDGNTDEGLLGTYYADVDGDGFGDDSTEMVGVCNPGDGYVTQGGDCDDDAPQVNPAAKEICNGIDDDCSGTADDGLATETYYADADGDSYGAGAGVESCEPVVGMVTDNTDCDDKDTTVNPGATEICNGVDDNCNHHIDEGVSSTWYKDGDSDGYGGASTMDACTQPAGYSGVGGDCDDAQAAAYPGNPEICDSIDNDCNGAVDDGLMSDWYKDSDGDTYGDPSTKTSACSSPGAGWVTNDGDCNDSEPKAWTGAAEVCDSIDNDCDGKVDEDVSSTWYADADGDGHGDASSPYTGCAAETGYVTSSDDCNDAVAADFPGNDEICDGIDNDCDSQVDSADSSLTDGTDYPADNDGDGYGDAIATVYACSGVDNTLDCDDANPAEPVAVDGTGAVSGSVPTIGDGISMATECVVVYPGTYTEAIDFGGMDLLVESVDGPSSTVIYYDGLATGSNASVVSIMSGETSAAELTGFTIAGGNGTKTEVDSTGGCASSETCDTKTITYFGGGIYVDGASPTLTDLIVTGNELPGYNIVVSDATHQIVTYSYGGGIYVNNGMASLSMSTVAQNNADVGGGLFVASSAEADVSTSKVIFNYAYTDGGGYAVQGTVNAKNGLIVSNSAASDGGGVAVIGGTANFENDSFVGNSAAYGGAASVDDGSFSLVNSIVFASPTGYGVYDFGTGTTSISYTNFYGNSTDDVYPSWPSTGSNISSDPMFVSWSDNSTDDDDFHLQSGSPSIDAGNPAAAYNDADTTRNDQGAYGGSGSSW